jgi:hypothetical protein
VPSCFVRKHWAPTLRVKRVVDWPSTTKIFQQRAPGTPKLELIAVRYRPLLIRYVLHGARRDSNAFRTQMSTLYSSKSDSNNKLYSPNSSADHEILAVSISTCLNGNCEPCPCRYALQMYIMCRQKGEIYFSRP